jgi:hypothetical protein
MLFSIYWLAGNSVVTSVVGAAPVVSYGWVRSATQPVQVEMGLVEVAVQALATDGVGAAAVHRRLG